VSGGTFRTHSGLRATINAWLEDISFRTGMITGAVVLLVIAAASGAGRESYWLASPAGWRHGLPRGWDGRGWAWGPYRGGPHFGGSWR
jgi:hypothetical protein